MKKFGVEKYCKTFTRATLYYASTGTSYSPVSVCLSVCLSVCHVTSRCSFETDERIELGFGMGASFHLSCTVLKGNSGISKNNGILTSGTLFQTPDLENFATHIDHRNVLST